MSYERRATNLLILRKWRGFENQITNILFKIWPTDRFSKAKSYNFYFHKKMSHDLLVQIGLFISVNMKYTDHKKYPKISFSWKHASVQKI